MSDLEIPKTIHYCWFGKGELPVSAKKCIESWKHKCPDYQIIEWNESNFDINCCNYVRQAYDNKKWAFVSDVARFIILFQNGGVYLDTDVELLTDLSPTLSKGPFMGVEQKKPIKINPGLGMAANKGNRFLKQMIDYYFTLNFVLDDGTLNQTTIVEHTTRALIKGGLKQKNKVQNICGFTIYPKDYLCPKDYITNKIDITSNTISIHHYEASWYSESDKEAVVLREKYSKFMPKKMALKLSRFVIIKRKLGFFGALKYGFKRIRR